METQVPGVVQSDNGSEFGDFLDQMCRHFGGRLIHTSVGHPQANGCVERQNQIFKKMISAMLMNAPTFNWSFQVCVGEGWEGRGEVGRTMEGAAECAFRWPSRPCPSSPSHHPPLHLAYPNTPCRCAACRR
jgi:transposase InsO family protein